MKRYIIFTGLLIVIFTFFNLALARNVTKVDKGINDNQPISMGEVIYEKVIRAWQSPYEFYHIKYTYTGYDKHGFKIRYEYSMDDDTMPGGVKNEAKIIILPLEMGDKAYLQIHQIPKYPQKAMIPAKVLRITLSDNNNFPIYVDEVDNPR